MYSACLCVCVCVCVCVLLHVHERKPMYKHTHTHTHTPLNTYIFRGVELIFALLCFSYLCFPLHSLPLFLSFFLSFFLFFFLSFFLSSLPLSAYMRTRNYKYMYDTYMFSNVFSGFYVRENVFDPQT